MYWIGEVTMRRSIIVLAGWALILAAGFLTWGAEATPLGSSIALQPGVHDTLLEDVGCHRAGPLCPLGLHRVCRGGECKCIPCVRGCWYVHGIRYCS